MKLTKEAISELVLPDGKADHIVWDDELPSFGVRLRGASKRFVVQFRFGSQQRRESLGDVRKVTLEAARKIARNRFAQVELGTDPAAEKAKVREQAKTGKLTLATVAERYLAAKEDVLRPSTYKAAKRYFARQWAPLGERPIDAIKRADVAATLQDIIRAHGRTSAARARGNLSALYGWAMREGLCEVNPVIATNDPAAGIKPRERVLADHEIRAIWNACRENDFGRIVRLLLLLGCRREEIGALRWTEIDFNTGVMTIPGTRTKGHRTLEVTLPPVALEILRSSPRRDGRDYVFGERGGAFSAWSYATLALNARIAEGEGKPLAHWTLHDLRRTLRTGMSKLGVLPHVAELVIGHARGGVEAIYDRHRYSLEIKAALARWAAYVTAIVEGRESEVATNVVALVR
jgi:integrase